MDTNATLASIRRLAEEVGAESEEPLALGLAELIQDLDEWLSRGGFLPLAWESS